MTTKQRLALSATIIGSGIVFLDGSVVNIALPKIGTDLHTGFAGLQWIVDGYLLTLAALILLGGSLGDIFGRKRIYTIGLLGFGLSSLACGLAPNISVLVAFRMLQGAFGALLVPGSLAIINATFPKDVRGKAIGVWTAFSGITTAVGPLLGGWLLDTATWRWIFFINIPLVIACWYLTKVGVEESYDKAEQKRKLDVIGCVLAVIGLGAVTYGLIQGPVDNWRGLSLVGLISGFVILTAFVLVEAKRPDPLMNLSLFRSRNFTGTNIATVAMYGALSGAFFALIIYLQNVMKYTSLQAGATLIPVTIILFLLSSRIGAWSAKVGSRLFMTFGPIIAGLGLLLLLPLKPGSSVGWVLVGIIVFGLGLAITVAPLTTTVMTAVDESQSGIASAINNAASRIGGLVVVAALGIFVSSQINHTISNHAAELNFSLNGRDAISRSVASGKPDPSLNLEDQAVVKVMITESAINSYRLSMLLCALLAIGAGGISFAYIRNK